MTRNRVGFVLLICGYLAGCCDGRPQNEEAHQQPIGAYRVYQKTHFQCSGRPSGYYADVETGCQVYHMCDGLGRQFSYSCPNTTLFQQRMLICDHWYMVNCSRAESNYDANLLIGQRDKPFVTDQENELRTPRPDLLDRPYAADYAGESFRNQYNLSPPNENSLDDIGETAKPEAPFVRPNQPYTFATHWSTQHPSKLQATVNPAPLTPSLESDLLPPFQQPSQHLQASAFETNGSPQSVHSHDLQLSSSQDSLRSEPESNFINSIPTGKPHLKKPQFNSKEQQHTQTQQSLPASTATTVSFTQQFRGTEGTTLDTAPPSTIPDRTPQPFVNRRPAPTATTSAKDSANRGQTKFTHPHKEKPSLGETSRILSRPANQPIASAPLPATVASPPSHRPSAPAPPPNDLLPPFDKLQYYDDATTQGPPIYSQWKIPASGLLPPLHTKINRASSATNQLSPPTAAAAARPNKPVAANSVPVSALKRPANGLQPPRFESPSTEAPSSHLIANSQHNLFRKSNLVQTTPSFPLSVGGASFPTTEASVIIPSEAAAAFAAHHQHNHHKSPTPRSIPPTANRVLTPATNRDNHYLELKKLLHIPDYVFPLETDTVARGQYVRDDSVNSFQVRIPLDVNVLGDEEGAATATAATTTTITGGLTGATGGTSGTAATAETAADTESTTGRTRRTPWYGENAACPECHPSFVKAGSCEPCVKIRR